MQVPEYPEETILTFTTVPLKFGFGAADEAGYEAMIANKVLEQEAGRVAIAGRFCESGDILIRDIGLPPVSAGDIIAIPVCGAYCLSMASNYNASLKPAVIMVKDGGARLIRRRETFDDLTGCDLV